MREGAISSATLLKRLRSGSHKNATYVAFREVGRVIRTVQLLRYLTDAPLPRRVTVAINKVESFGRRSERRSCRPETDRISERDRSIRVSLRRPELSSSIVHSEVDPDNCPSGAAIGYELNSV
ncbi:Tn3 family transposase [Streptomyces iranensis]|uniref:Tn3 family transposase n=1 Tax=Streptomyces iranensis TaxID=576784 RepID=UPI0036D36520